MLASHADLAPNATKELTSSWNLSGVPYGVYDLKAVATLEGDVKPDNDECVVYDAVKVKLLGDFNGDDFILFSEYYGVHY